jgi:hypothetical protein
MIKLVPAIETFFATVESLAARKYIFLSQSSINGKSVRVCVGVSAKLSSRFQAVSNDVIDDVVAAILR